MTGGLDVLAILYSAVKALDWVAAESGTTGWRVVFQARAVMRIFLLVEVSQDTGDESRVFC